MGPSCFVSLSLGCSCSFGRAQGFWCWKALYAVSISLHPGIVRPAFVAHVQRYAWKTRRAGQRQTERNRAWWVPHWAMNLICAGPVYTMVMVAPMRRGLSTLPAGSRWMSVYVATSGPC